jgi:hypothetical protein
MSFSWKNKERAWTGLEIPCREKNFGEILQNSLLSARGETGPFQFENLGPFKTDPVPIDTAAQAHSTANPNSPKYAISSLGIPL